MLTINNVLKFLKKEIINIDDSVLETMNKENH